MTSGKKVEPVAVKKCNGMAYIVLEGDDSFVFDKSEVNIK